MNINFSTIKFNPNYINANYAKANILATNPIASKQTNLTDQISFGGVSSDPIIYKLCLSEQSTGKIAKLRAELIRLEKDNLAGKITQPQYVKKAAKVQENIDTLTQQIEKLSKEIQKVEEFRKRPNAAFIYDSSLTPKQKEKEIQNHPEFKTMEQLAKDTRLGIKYSNRHFIPDIVNGTRYIDVSYEGNKKNYEALLENSDGLISIYEFSRETGLPEDLVKSLCRRGVIKSFELADVYNGQPVPTNLLPKEILDKADNIRTLIPEKSLYYKSILPENNENLPLVPIRHLSELGYGTVGQLYSMYQNKFLRGEESIVEKNGKKYKQVKISIASTTAENNLEKAKAKNKNYLTIPELARQLKVRKGEIERSIIDGKLVANNKYLFSSPDGYQSGICLYNTQNQQYIEKVLIEQQAEAEIVPETQTVKEEKAVIPFRLLAKIAWYFSPETKKVASELAKGDGFLARVIEKEQRIRASEDEETAEQLTGPEQGKISGYRKKMWEKAGKREYTEGFSKARKILRLYREQGIDAIEDPEIRKIIEKYMS